MSTNDGYVCFFRDNFYFSPNFFFTFYSTKRRNKRLKLCEKKIDHHTRLGENNLLIIWPTYPQIKPLGSDCARGYDARNYAQ